MHAAGTSLEPSNIHMGVCNYLQCSTGISVLSLLLLKQSISAALQPRFRSKAL